MVNKCIAPNCSSGYSSTRANSEKIHFFKVPKDLVAEYQKALKRKNFIVTAGQFVCEKHFLKEEVIWKREVKNPAGNVIASVCINKYINNN